MIPRPLPEAFSTPRLRAERLTAGHLADVRRIHQNPMLMALLGGIRDEAETDAYLEKNLAHWDQYGFGLWVLRVATTGELAGLGCLRHLMIDGLDEIEIGYSLFPELWGQGLATEVAIACADLGLRVLRWPSVVALTRPQNTRSQRVLIKAGLVLERELIHAEEPHLLFRRGASPGVTP
jgi:ribosomal-protein-alanine N-acetyltransferase